MLRKKFAFVLLCLSSLVFNYQSLAQEVVGTASVLTNAGSSTLLVGQFLTSNIDDDVVLLEYSSLDGPTTYGYGLLDADGKILADVIDNEWAYSPTATVEIKSVTSSEVYSRGNVIVVDTNDLGEDWTPTPVDPNSPDPLPGNCGEVAEEILDLPGGDATIVSTQSDANTVPNQYPLEGTYRGKGTGWFYHDVVVKDGRVYDGFTDRYELPIDDYKNLWSDKDNILFGF